MTTTQQLTTAQRITARPAITGNVRIGGRRVHMVTPASQSVILNRSAAPLCGAYIGSPAPREVTDAPVTCPNCQQADANPSARFVR